jgi:hypothetical protein
MAERRCDEPTVARVFWPGREPLVMCAKHERGARTVAAAIGLHLHTEPATQGTCESMVSDD